jgi:hypothetical protein
MERNHLKNMGVNRRIILNKTLKIWCKGVNTIVKLVVP